MTTPAPSILDTIDNAIADYELSGDAMRWTPERTTPTVAAGPDIAALAESCGFALDAWQRAVTASGLATPRVVVPTSEQLHAAIAPVRRVLTEALKGFGQALGPILDETRWGKPRRSERVARMRRAYRAKRGRRW